VLLFVYMFVCLSLHKYDINCLFWTLLERFNCLSDSAGSMLHRGCVRTGSSYDRYMPSYRFLSALFMNARTLNVFASASYGTIPETKLRFKDDRLLDVAPCSLVEIY
jgi:hypothetical protein